MDFSDLRKNYKYQELNEENSHASPFQQFLMWFEDALKTNILEPNAMVLSTSNLEGKISSRTVLMKHFSEKGLIFYTNTESRKAVQIKQNPCVAITFLWLELERQVIMEGTAKKISQKENETYFHSRPRGSQLGAWASRQDKVIHSRDILEKELAILKNKYEGREIPLPPFWGGFLIIPSVIEFWQGREDRLHDRLRYRKEGAEWIKERLSP